MLSAFPAHAALTVNVTDHGARGDGTVLDNGAINRTIAAVSRAGGGTVVIPRGHYLCFSIRLLSHVSLRLAEGAVIEAADPARHAGKYDPPENNGEQLYQDFGHSHWHNSLIWGDGIENAAITGPGLIHGAGLTRDGPGARWAQQTGERPLSMHDMSAEEIAQLEPDIALMHGRGNKAIALRNARNIRLSGFRILKGGHFAILASGVDGLVIEDLAIDTERDGIDLDCVRNAQVANCRVNTPNDDAIVLKSSLALGRAIPTEHVTIRDCTVSGYDMGTMLDGSFRKTQDLAPDRDRVTGRIKLGTESNGGYRHIRIENCRFERCRGLALEMVDGGVMEDVVVRGIAMRDVTTAPFFLRLGDRRRGPEGTGMGAIRGISISGLDAEKIDHRFAATIAGLGSHAVEDVELKDIRLTYRGGGTAADAARRPAELADAYPEPSMFGILPAWGLWMRHARDVRIDGLHLETALADARPPILAENVAGLTVRRAPLWHA